MPGADVAVPGLCLSDYWAFWTPGTLAAAAAAPLGEGGERRRRRKEGRKAQMRENEFGVCLQVGIVNFVWICTAPAWLQLRDAIYSPPHQLTPTSPRPRMLKHHPSIPTAKADFRVISLGVRECQHQVGIRHQRNQNVTKRCKIPFQRASSIAPLKYCMWYHSFVCKVCRMQSLKGTRGPSAPEICRNAPFV